ncbi:MAG: hypothetical protein RLZZ461_1873, partial [Planctomycetota bacterium]
MVADAGSVNSHPRSVQVKIRRPLVFLCALLAL